MKKGRRCPYCGHNLTWDPQQEHWYCTEHGSIGDELWKYIKK
jgi:endogenous inhibitor of DNA gyrase (YacG/DUF329 family)